ncbi:MAG: hypothetical protein U9N10_07740 [Bacillota bacterium]|nr:hypothetical protein [Bacillota bacterium]
MISRKFIKSFIHIITTIVVIATMFLSVSYAENIDFMGESLIYTEKYTSDIDENGYEELIFYMNENVLVLAIWDTNEDGIKDNWYSYEKDDVLVKYAIDENQDGKPDKYFNIDSEGESSLIEYEEKSSVPILYIIGSISFIIIIFIILLLFKNRNKNKNKTTLIALFLATILLFNTTSSYSNIIDEKDCTFNEDVFNKEWIKYSHIDSRLELKTRSPEAQEVQLISDSIRSNYASLLITELQIELEKDKREELKTIKKLLVENIKTNLSKCLIRLSFVTYDTIKSGYELKGSIKAILNRATAGAQVISSWIKVQNTLSIPSKTGKAGNALIDSVKNITNSTILETVDTVFNPKAIAKNLVKDIKKEIVGSIKANDPSTDANLTDEDYKILRVEYLRNRELDVAILESDMIIRNILIPQREYHTETIELLKKQYIEMMTKEKERVKDQLLLDCKKNNEKEVNEVNEENTDNENITENNNITDLSKISGEWNATSKINGFYDNCECTNEFKDMILNAPVDQLFIIIPEEPEVYTYSNAYCSLYAYNIVINGNHISMTIEQRIKEFSGYTIGYTMIVDVMVNDSYTIMSGSYDFGTGTSQPDMYGAFQAVRKK